MNCLLIFIHVTQTHLKLYSKYTKNSVIKYSKFSAIFPSRKSLQKIPARETFFKESSSMSMIIKSLIFFVNKKVCSWRFRVTNAYSKFLSKTCSVCSIFRSIRPNVFCQTGVLRNFAKFTGKHLCQSLYFNKVAGLRPATLLKKRLWHRCFSVNFVKFLGTPFPTEHLR